MASEHTSGARITRIVLEVGVLTAILPDAIRFCFDLCAEGTEAEGATLEIVETPGRARCRDCGGDVTLEQPFGLCDCGGFDLEWLAGAELKIREITITADG